MPEYAAEDIARRPPDQEFKAVVTETQRIMGRMLSVPELKTLFGIYDYLGLPAEVILTLINHCVEEYQEKHGPGRIPHAAHRKEAYIWANREILTLRAPRLTESSGKVCPKPGKGSPADMGRDLPPRRKIRRKLAGDGLWPDAIAIAYDKTIVKTGQLQWRYMNSIITSWHNKGLHTAKEIEKGICFNCPSKDSKQRQLGASKERV